MFHEILQMLTWDNLNSDIIVKIIQRILISYIVIHQNYKINISLSLLIKLQEFVPQTFA